MNISSSYMTWTVWTSQYLRFCCFRSSSRAERINNNVIRDTIVCIHNSFMILNKCCRELFEIYGVKCSWPNFLRYETSTHDYNPESSQKSMQLHKKGIDPPNKFKVSPSARKVMATEYMKKGQTINAASCATTSRQAIKEKNALFLNDNLPMFQKHFCEIVVSNKSVTHPIIALT